MSGPDPHLPGYRQAEQERLERQSLERARRFVADNHFSNVEVLDADARGVDLPDQTFDLATVRVVLADVPRPEEIVAEMVRLVRTGSAWVMIEMPTRRIWRQARSTSASYRGSISSTTLRMHSSQSS